MYFSISLMKKLEDGNREEVFEVVREADWDDTSVDVQDDIYEQAIDEFEKCIKVKVESSPCDVVITWFEDQGDFTLPVSLLRICAERWWSIEIELND